ncbi:Carboxylesterase, partial [Entophlyctis helioformis]
DEDCLSLSVWTPFRNASQLAAASQPLPVFVFIHGGSFEQGGADVADMRANELSAAIQAVVVTFNYRLGIFGFPGTTAFLPAPASPTSRTSPNLGILDQRMAIEWISANIRAFGGDPARMTLAGQSAGAMSAIIHMADPATKARFRNLILMS